MSLDVCFVAKAKMSSKGEVSVTLRGKSMSPFLCDGDTARIVAAGEYEKGRIYAFSRSETDELLVHRLIGFKGCLLVFKGDHTKTVERVPVSSVLGEVVGFCEYGEDAWSPVSVGAFERRATAMVSKIVGDSFLEKGWLACHSGILRIWRRLLCATLDKMSELKRSYLKTIKLRA